MDRWLRAASSHSLARPPHLRMVMSDAERRATMLPVQRCKSTLLQACKYQRPNAHRLLSRPTTPQQKPCALLAGMANRFGLEHDGC
uniref:Uncharacterized protein n=1 Tax=Setaria viridis TaxID=4556 RepID=A0A4U6UW53_SETVI|nr:hypothetical protein SEVIR_4G116701v2 [Setaria viridis]